MRHEVSVPFAGYVTAVIETDDPDPSPAKIASLVSEQIERLDLKPVKGESVEIGEWDVMGTLVQGNVSYLPLIEAGIDRTEK